MSEWREREPCDKHSFCLKHVTHPCEGCGRIAGVSLPPAWHDYITQLESENAAFKRENEGLMKYVPKHVLKEWEHYRALLTGGDDAK